MPAIEQSPQQPHNQKALLAEDDSLIRELVSTYLRTLGYDVLEASNGRDAIELLNDGHTGRLDLIVTDLVMPKASGETIIKQARERGVCNRFLVMSGNPIDPMSHATAPSKGSEYIEKPFSFGDFEAKLHSLETRPIAQEA
ncbi:hypothetical protein VDG1235_4347 [Verrucomicrobiia bacterium DG1235]|nr:hypothetical protein VDG1235_4347 [Verrucomicrobiae bacterium DG1235]